MADFIDSEAEEDSEMDEDEDEQVSPNKKKAKSQQKARILDSDEEEDDDNGEEITDLIDDRPIEEDSDGDSDGSRGGKRKKSDDEEDELDDRLEDDDYDLIEENLGVKVQRKKFKRLKRIQDEDSDDDENKDKGEDRDEIQRQLFEGGSDNEDEPRYVPREEPTIIGSEESEGEYSETDDFIVDDDGRPLTEKRQKRKKIFTDASLQEAQDIFGVDFDYDEFVDSEYDEEEDDEYEEDDEERGTRKQKKKQRKKKSRAIYDVYEPSELERAGITDEDNRIRAADIPERMQTRTVPVTPAEEAELEEEAEWIYRIAFSTNQPHVIKAKKLGTREDPISTVFAPSTIGGMDDEDDWNERQSVVQQPNLAKVIQPTIAEDDEENWDEESTRATTKGSERGDEIREDPLTVLMGPPPIPPPRAPVEGDEDWTAGQDQDRSEEPTQNIDMDDDDGPPKLSAFQDTEKIIDDDMPNITSEKVVQQEEEDDTPKKPPLQIMIQKVLECIRNTELEVPFIAFYRKEFFTKDKEMLLNINDFWKIYRLDAKFCQLRTRKFRLMNLYSNMKEYQTDLLIENPDDPIWEFARLINDDDIERIRKVRTMEELKDNYLMFSLYYGDFVQDMKVSQQRKRREKMIQKKFKNKSILKDTLTGPTDENAAEGGGEEKDPDDPDKPKDPESAEAPEDDDAEKDNEDDANELTESNIKRKIGGGTYNLCKKFGVEPFAKKFGLAPEKFAENLRDNYTKHDVEQYPISPYEVANDFINERLSTVGEVINAAKFMVATQISREPIVRSTVRDIFFERATLTVSPTKKGFKEIDEMHPLYPIKYLKDKPIKEVKDDMWLKLQIGEEDKLVEIIIGDKIRGITQPDYIEEAKELYHKDEHFKTVIDWNALRDEVVEFAIEKLLFPVIRKELRAKLAEESREYVLTACAKKLANWIKVAPYQPDLKKKRNNRDRDRDEEEDDDDDDDDDDWSSSKGIRVVSLAYLPGFDEVSFACCIGTDGEPSDYLRLQNITKMTKFMKESDKLEKQVDEKALKEFILEKRPHVIVIGAESRDSLMLQEDIRKLVDELVHEEDDFRQISVEIIDNNLAKLYANSNKAQNDFRDFPPMLRQAVSLGRRMQDPMLEFSQLCTPDEEILCLRYHTLQDYLPKDDLLEYLQLEFVSRTNEVGVDVNRCISCPYTSNILQFVCGLGLRKATALLKILKQNNQRLENRTQLITVCHMGPKIFVNCSGFIKIDTNSLGDSTEVYVEVLDGSRVHPETYEWARKIAVDSLSQEEEDEEEPNPATALEEILESPDKLKDLDLDAFAAELDRQGFGDKSSTLYDIRNELYKRYRDLRNPYSTPNPEELFNLVTKETPDTFFIGKLITAVVVGIISKSPTKEQLNNAVPVKNDATGLWQCAFCMKSDFSDLSEVWNHFDANRCAGHATGIRLRLDNGISGFIPIKNLSDNKVDNPEKRVKRGQTIHCRILKINVERFSIECTSRTSDLADINGDLKPAKDTFYNVELEKADQRREEGLRKNRSRQQYIKRVIVHPSFKNISYTEAEKMMEQMDQGEVIIRPSSKGSDHLTVTWKVVENIYQHIDVREEGKENAFSLGQSLWIGDEEFEDLDEIVARHVNQMASHARDIINYKYYNFSSDTGYGNRSTVEQYLLGEKSKNSNKIHYVIYPSKELPGKFLISYLPGNKVKHEFITVTRDGYRFRQQEHSKFSALLSWFKEHYKEPPPTNTPAITPRTQVAKTPFTPTDARSLVRPPEPSLYGGMSTVGHIDGNASDYETPNQAFTPFSSFNAHAQPYTPTAQTPFITPYQQTPSFQTPGGFPNLIPNPAGSTVSFLHPGAPMTPGHKTPQQQSSRIQKQYQQQQQQQQQMRIPTAPQSTTSTVNQSESRDWRAAAEAWARSQQKGSQRVGSRTPNINMAAGKSPAARNAAQIINEGITRTKELSTTAQNYMSSTSQSNSKSPRSGRESLKSTPRTNFSPRSMIESSLGDETPCYDEN